MFTDNDELSGLIAKMMNADTLILLSNVDGIYNGDPSEPTTRIIPTKTDTAPTYDEKSIEWYDKEIGKQNYVYLGDGKYRGMFIVGKLQNPLNPDWVCLGSREYKGQIINEVDQVAYFTRVKNDLYKKADGSYLYNSVADLPSTIPLPQVSSLPRHVRWVLTA